MSHRSSSFRAVRALRITMLCTAALCAACAARTKPAKTGLDAWRERAMESEDPRVWSTLAAYEWLADGGDADAAKRSLKRAEELGEPTLRSHLLAAEMHVLHGEPQQAFERYVRVLEVAPRAPGGMAAWAAELSLDALQDMRDTVPRYDERMREVVETLAPHAAALGPHVQHDLAALRHSMALKSGDAAVANEVWQALGCVQKGRVAGPFGPREMLSFDVALPAEKPGPLAEHYDLDAARKQVSTRALHTRHCVLGLGRGVREPRGGSHVMRAEFDVKSSGPHVLRVETPNSFVLWVDDKPVSRVDRRDVTGSPVHFYARNVTAGRHSVRLKVTSRHPNPALRVLVTPDAGAGLRGVELPDPDDGPLARYVAAKLALARNDVVAARQLTNVSKQKAPSAPMLVLHSAAALSDPLRGGDLRRDKARTALRRAGARDPRAWYPQLTLANLEAAEGHLLESIEGLRAAKERWPEVLAIHLSLVQRLQARGWVEAAEHALDAASEHFEGSCTLVAQQLAMEKQRERAARVQELTERMMECDASSTARFHWLKERGQGEQAARELERLQQLADVPYGAQLINTQIDLAALRGDEELERKLRKQRAEEFPKQPGFVLDRADLTLAYQGRDPARSYLGKALDAQPDALFELRNVYEALGGKGAFEGLRLDGEQIIADYEASWASYGEPQVLVLDYTVMRVLPDGSSLDLTHNIIRVQSQEAVDAMGEWTPPDGARLLKLQTVKADGRRLEPDRIKGKDSYSLPSLSPGDYVEFEYVLASAPSVGFVGGYMGDRFYFKSFEVPFHRSELVMVLPAGVEPVIERRGDAPETERTQRGDEQVLRFVAKGSEPLEAEPDAVPMKEFLPSVLVGYDADWPDYVESLRDLLADKAPHDPAAEAHVRRLLAGAEDAPLREKVSRLHAWVTEEIAPTEDLFGLAPQMWASRTGSRDRVLHYMLHLAGIDSELVLVRSKAGDHSASKLPDPSTYGFLLLRIPTEKGPLWVSTAERGAPLSYLPESLRGEPGLVLNAKAETARVPAGEPQDQLRSVELEVWPEADGSGTLHVRETLRGTNAVSWRQDLRSIPSAELDARFESGYVAQRFPGGKLTALEVQGLTEPGQPLVLDYRVEQANMARAEGDKWVLQPLMPSMLAARFARVAERTTAQVVGPAHHQDLRIEVHVPEGGEIASLPATMETEGPGGARFSSQAERSGGSAVVHRSLRVPFMRVPPEKYDAFATFCRAVDLAEASELSVRLPSSRP